MESVLTLRVDGEVEIDAHGRVASHKLDTPLPDEFQTLIGKAIAGWKFMPPTEDDKPVDRTRSRMRIALAAHEVGKVFVMKVENVTFPGSPSHRVGVRSAGSLMVVERSLPKYDGTAEALLTLQAKVDRTGRVLDVSPSQCTVLALRKNGNAEQAWRTLERNSVAAIRGWAFEFVPGDDPELEPDFATANVALNFVTSLESPAKQAVPGQWRRELRSPYRNAPWSKPIPRASARRMSAAASWSSSRQG
jgi:hypothetical protein